MAPSVRRPRRRSQGSACYNPRRLGAPQAALRSADSRAMRAERRMKKGFYTIMSAQFFSSLADNALFVAAVELLRTADQASTM